MYEHPIWHVRPYFEYMFFLFFLVIVLIYFRRVFWGKLLVISLILSEVTKFVYIHGPIYEPAQNEIFPPILMYANALLILAIASVARRPRAERPAAANAPVPETRTGPPGKTKSIIATVALLIVTLNIYWVFWLYRTVKDIRKFDSTMLKFTPGRAVGYLFIPVANFVWFCYLFVTLPMAISRLDKRYRRFWESCYSVPVVFIFAVGGLGFNLFSWWSYSFLILGELMTLTVFAYSQYFLNRIWKSAGQPAPTADACKLT